MGKNGNSEKNVIERLLSPLFKKNVFQDDFDPGEKEISTESFPLLPLRDLVLFPDTVISLFLKMNADTAALEEARRRENRLFASCFIKREAGMESEPCEIGTVVRIINRLKLPDNTCRVVLQCEYRAEILSISEQNDFSMVKVQPVKNTGLGEPLSPDDLALIRSIQKSFSQYAEYSRRISADTLSAVERSENPERIANLVCNATYLKLDKKLELLKYTDTRERLLAILETLERENEIYGIQRIGPFIEWGMEEEGLMDNEE